MIQDFFSKLLIGVQVAANTVSVDKESVAIWPFILNGEYDHEVRCFLFYKRFNSAAQLEEELLTPEITAYLEQMKQNLRNKISNIFDAADREEELIQRAALELRRKDILDELKKTNLPHEMGTVAEIAAKYGLSKSEVRRRKADGTLNEFLNINKQPATK